MRHDDISYLKRFLKACVKELPVRVDVVQDPDDPHWFWFETDSRRSARIHTDDVWMPCEAVEHIAARLEQVLPEDIIKDLEHKK